MRTTAESEALARKLRADVLEFLAARPGEWVPAADLLALAPEGRATAHTEIGDTPFGSDDPRGPAYDADGSGKPDGSMLADVMRGIAKDLLAEEGGIPWGIRLHDPDGPVGLKEVAHRLGVKEATAHTWQARGVLPEPTWPEVGGRPAWRWSAIRDWALETGRDPRGPNSPRWNRVNGADSGTIVDSATGNPIAQ